MIGVDAVVVLLAIAGILGISHYLASRSGAVRIAHVPPGIEPGGKAETYYRLCRRMAHELDGVLIQDSNLPVLSPEQRTKIQAVLRDWEEA